MFADIKNGSYWLVMKDLAEQTRHISPVLSFRSIYKWNTNVSDLFNQDAQ